MSKDYYNILGVKKEASADEIKAAFRKKAHEHHPDKGGDEAKFKEINEAYQVLGNQSKRQQYDQFGSAFQNGQAGGFGGQGFGGFDGMNINMDDLGDIFGGFGDIFGFGANTNRRTRAQRGRDLEMIIKIDFLESILGAEKEISFPHLAVCKHCQGSGHAADAKIETCTTCNGTGHISRIQRTILGAVQTQSLCPDCQGEGKKASHPCPHCQGQGRERKTEKIKVKIPAGIKNNESIRLANYGDAGERSAPAGDLFLRVQVASHPSLHREGDDIHSQATITVKEAILGTKIKIATAFGDVSLKIPAGTQSHTTFRLKDKGAPRLHGRGQGDHFVQIKVIIPTNISKKDKKLLEDLDL
ncbi:MAG: molecular chaperone DnaJ [Patescibacteria group bacterium]|jgi:molecular chaperone DnaJ|nr:molecular chaperone DnaJ [Patescibacteria group bacterium]